MNQHEELSMLKDFESLKRQLTELAGVINTFKSEAVQIKIIDLLFQNDPILFSQKSHEAELLPDGKRSRQVEKRNQKNGKKVRETKKSNRSRPGPSTILNRLLEQGFFKKKKTLGDIIDYCSSKMAYKYKPNELSGSLARFARNKLDREKNADRQYEYIQK
ncbi:MAG: hypothetical protein HUU45_15570 [Leptospiraceae bacterium]|nr:hypothetical protein [Leptospiraceae bacterium]